MRLSTKLKISFGFLILLPICILVSSIWGLSVLNLKNIENKYNTESLDYDTIVNPLQLVGMMCKVEYERIEDAIKNELVKLHDNEFLQEINDALRERNACLMVIEGGKYIYTGEKFAPEIMDYICNINATQVVEKQGIYSSTYRLMINGIPYKTIDGKDGVVFLVVKINRILPQIKRLAIDVIIAMFISLLLTSSVFIVWIYKSTVKPIKKLQLATNNIKNGNLDFELNVDGNNDFAELCKDFDNMRKRLKFIAEEKIKQDAESKEMISNITHDLKTPITAIKGYVEGIIDGVADSDEKMDRYIKTIYNKACDMDSLIDELTFYSQVDSNKVNYNFSKINIASYFEDCIEEIKPELEELGIELRFINRLEPDVNIAADPIQFKKVINNIIGNSSKYMQIDNGLIEIELYEEDREIHIDISDNGKGIAPKDIEHIFDRFYRSDTSRNSSKGGSGIGLSIVKKIIMDHGGSVSAVSEPGVRTSIKIILDRYKETNHGKENINN